MNFPPSDDAQLEAWYRSNVSAAPLPDDGFSRRVLAALPAPAHRAAIQRRLFCLAGALTGAVVALGGALGSGTFPVDPAALEAEISAGFARLADPAVAWALGITALSWCFVFRPRMRLLARLF